MLPRRLGPAYSLLLGSTWVSNIGDGIALAAGPLLMASVTRDPLLVAAAAVLQRLPWVLFGLYAGVLADRLDRKRMVVAVDVARAIVLLLFTVALTGGTVHVWLVLAVMFLLGTAETFADTASPTLLPMIVDPPDLGIALSLIHISEPTRPY